MTDSTKILVRLWNGDRVVSESKSLAQTGSVMFERNIAIKASKEEEVGVSTFLHSFRGFVCGLDDNWLQICGEETSKSTTKTPTWDLILINRQSIVSVFSTGRNIESVDPKSREFVQRKISTFVSVSKTFQDKNRTR